MLHTHQHTRKKKHNNNETSIKWRQENINSISLFGACSIVSSRVVCCWQPSRMCNIRTRLCHLMRLWKYTHARTLPGWETEIERNAIKRNARYKYLFMLTIRWATKNKRISGSYVEWCCCCGGDGDGVSSGKMLVLRRCRTLQCYRHFYYFEYGWVAIKLDDATV